MINANSVDEEIRILRERYKANPEALKDVLILTPANKVDDRRAEYPDKRVILDAGRPDGIQVNIVWV